MCGTNLYLPEVISVLETAVFLKNVNVPDFQYFKSDDVYLEGRETVLVARRRIS